MQNMDGYYLSLTLANGFATLCLVSWSLLRESLMSRTQENAYNLNIELAEEDMGSSLHDHLSNGRHLLRVSFLTSLKPNLCTVVTAHDTTENCSIILNAQNTTAPKPNEFLTGKHRLLVTSEGWSAFYSANHCQGQMHTPQSLAVGLTPR
jgi:hypothetical protein